MKVIVSTKKPFSFGQSLEFAGRFAPLESAAVVGDDSLTVAFAQRGRGWPVTIRATRSDAADRNAGAARAIDDLEVTMPERAPVELARRAADLLSANDDIAPFYDAAEHDSAMRPVVRSLYGLHQVRFIGLEEIAVYCVMMQRNPQERATRMKDKFLKRFGYSVTVGDHTLRAMPELDELAAITPEDIATAIGHRGKAERIATVVRGVAKLGETFLREAPYARARDALLAIPGVGPFSAGAILLRGLGRTDELPSLEMFEAEGRSLYGSAWLPSEISARYREHIGMWAFYLKIAANRAASSSGRPSGSGMKSPSRGAAGGASPRRSRGSRRGRAMSRAASPAS